MIRPVKAHRLAALIDAQEEQEALLGKSIGRFITDMLDLAVLTAKRVARYDTGFGGIRNSPQFESLFGGISRSMTLADIAARRRVLLWRDAVLRERGLLASSPTTISPFVPQIRFEDAITDIIEREPRLAIGYRRVQRAYNTPGGKAFAAAKSASEKLTERVQREVQRALESGEPGDEVIERIQTKAREEFHDWSRAYAKTVYRTNVATAYEAGKFEELKDPDVASVIVALQYVTAGDADVRPDHAKLEGLTAAADDPVWETHAPPLFYNCRCTLDYVDRFDAQDRGIIGPGGIVNRQEPKDFTGEAPNPDFRQIRPDRQVYG